MMLNRVMGLILIVLVFPKMYGQTTESWKVIAVKNTYLEIGVLKPALHDLAATKKQYLNSIFLIEDSVLYFPNNLRHSENYADSVFIKSKHILPRTKDTEISFRYPGDELYCSLDSAKLGKCYVGDSFMRLLEHKGRTLSFYDLKSKYPNYYSYWLCEIVSNRTMGLYLQNSFVLLILQKIK